MYPLIRFLSASLLVLAAGNVSAALMSVSAADGVVGADTTLDFDSAAGFLGVVYAPVPEVEIEGLSLTGFTGGGFPNISGRWINAGGSPSTGANDTTIRFLGTVTAAAVAIATNPGTSVMTAFLDGVEQATYSLATSTGIAANRVGFEGMPFDTLVISPGGTNGAHHIDNLQFSGLQAASSAALPSPGTLALLLAGVALVGLRRGQARA